MSTTSTIVLPASRNGPITSRSGDWFRDRDGAIATTKRKDELLQVVLDWSQMLAPSESISSVAYEDRGVTRSSTSSTGSTTTTSVTGVGELEVTVTMSTGRIVQRVVRFCGVDDRESDYR